MTLFQSRRTMLVQGAALAIALITGNAGLASADALEDITKAGTVRIGLFEDFPPFASLGSDMKLQGYDVDMAEKLATALGVKPEIVGITGQNRIPYLTEKRVDILMSVGYSKEREQVIDFAAAYAPYYIAVIGPKALAVKGKEDLADKSIAVNRGTLEDTSLTEAAPASADIRRFDNYNSVIQAFISGQTQLMVVGNDVGAAVLAKQPDSQPESKFQLLNSPSAMAINKGEDRLLAKIDEALAQMKKDGTLDAICKKWLFIPLPPEL